MHSLATAFCILLGLASLTSAVFAQEKREPKAKPATLYKTPEAIGRAFVTAVTEKRFDDATKLFITKKEFLATFAGDDLSKVYDHMFTDLRKRLKKLSGTIRGAKYSKMDLSMSPIAKTKPGMDFGSARFIIATEATDNTRVVVRIENHLRSVKLDAMVKVGGTWKLISPDFELLDAIYRARRNP
jgi:hypothetical protein